VPYIAAIPTLIGGRHRSIGGEDPTVAMEFPYLEWAILLVVSCPCWPVGRNDGLGAGTGAGRARRARRLPGRAMLRPCFLVSCLETLVAYHNHPPPCPATSNALFFKNHTQFLSRKTKIK
jgi:hypothetical protein